MPKYSFNATNDVANIMQLMLSEGMYSSKTELLNAAVLELYASLTNKSSAIPKCIGPMSEPAVPTVLQSSQSPVQDAAPYASKAGVKVSVVECTPEIPQEVSDTYYWELLAHLVNPTIYPFPDPYGYHRR